MGILGPSWATGIANALCASSENLIYFRHNCHIDSLHHCSYTHTRAISMFPLTFLSECTRGQTYLGSQHPSPNVKNPLRIRAANWLGIITSRDAKSTCFKGSQTSCTEIISGENLAPKKTTSRDGCGLLNISRLAHPWASPRPFAALCQYARVAGKTWIGPPWLIEGKRLVHWRLVQMCEHVERFVMDLCDHKPKHSKPRS